ncbi:MAG: transporter substrate-binding domain-containing protein [Aliarcobacter sp.]|nr:transporter substrate-binding domain-containing protein [Aliarcobacter sp.]
MKIIFLLFTFIFINLSLLNANDLIKKLTKEELEFLQKNQPLRLHNEQYWPPYNFNENGVPKGFMIDYMNLISKKLDVKIQFISGPSWNEFMEMLKTDQLDAIINIAKNDEREKFFNFTNTFHSASNAIYVKKGDENLDSLEKLKGKTIVMPKGFFAQQFIEKYYPEIKQILVKDSLEALELLSLGKADATVDKKNVLDYLISTKNISLVVPANYVNDDRLVSHISIATSKDKPLLNSILNKAQNSITEEELLNLKRKWFGSNEIIDKKKFLTNDEKNYLKNKSIVKVCNIIDLKPLEFKEDNNLKGINIDLLTLMANKLDITLEYINSENKNEALQYLENKSCDILPIISKNETIKNIANITNPIHIYKLAIVTQSGKPVIQDINEIINQKMAKNRNSEYSNILKETYPNLDIYETNSDYQTLEAVNSNKAQFALEPLPIVAYYMSKYALNNIFISRYTDMLLETNLAISKDNQILFEIFNKTIKEIDTNEQTTIFNKWTNISKKEPFDYVVLWKYLSVILVIICVIAYRQIILYKHNKKLKIANNEIEEKNRQIAKQKELFEKLYSKSADGVLLIKDKKIVDCNEASLKILQYSKDELLGKFLSNISPEFQPNNESSIIKATNKINEALNNGISSFEWVYINKQDEFLWIEVVLTSIEIDNNPMIHAVIRDINKRKEMEQKLEVLTYSLEERVNEEIKKNQEKTKQLIQQSRLAQMGEMLSMIAHQWRQPLTAISATTNNLQLKILLNEEIDNYTLKEELELITNYSQHLSLTIDDFRNFFKPDKVKMSCKIEDIIEKSINIIKTSFESKNINLITNYNFNSEIFSYANEIQQVILIILKNAEDILMEKNIENKLIKINTFKENNFAIIQIEDNGGGIAMEIINKIFDPYFSTKKSKEGTGIGLYMSKIIIDEHCLGNLSAKNSTKGAIFEIKLPIKI